MFNRNTSDHPAYMVDAIPGAREALTAYEATRNTPEEAEARRAQRAEIDSHAGRYIYRDGQPERRGETTHAEIDVMIAALRTATELVDSFATATRSAKAAYDRIFTHERFVEAGVPAIAAQHALDRHAEAVAAWATLQRVLPERDGAWLLAGQPGLSWWAGGGIAPQRGGADYFYGQALSAFPVEAVEAVAGLGDFSTELRAELSKTIVQPATPVQA